MGKLSVPIMYRSLWKLGAQVHRCVHVHPPRAWKTASRHPSGAPRRSRKKRVFFFLNVGDKSDLYRFMMIYDDL
jgi:hypothetical protein